jgi:hypothetical protein
MGVRCSASFLRRPPGRFALGGQGKKVEARCVESRNRLRLISVEHDQRV